MVVPIQWGVALEPYRIPASVGGIRVYLNADDISSPLGGLSPQPGPLWDAYTDRVARAVAAVCSERDLTRDSILPISVETKIDACLAMISGLASLVQCFVGVVGAIGWLASLNVPIAILCVVTVLLIVCIVMSRA